MTALDNRIREDLRCLFDNREMDRAVNLRKNLEQKFSTKGEPSHFYGDRNARTVMVMLNPGCEPGDNDKNFGKISRNWNRRSLNGFIADYMDHRANGAGRCPECCRADSFDVKQAAFLKSWADCGVDIPKNFESKENKLLAKRNVLLQKLQLELVPFASRKFTPKVKEYKFLHPYLLDCLDEIFSKKRKYVVFCGNIFYGLLKSLQEAGELDVCFSDKVTKDLTDKIKCNYTVACIKYNGKSHKVLIAHTFPHQGLSKAYARMEKYGRFCYRQFLKKCKFNDTLNNAVRPPLKPVI